MGWTKRRKSSSELGPRGLLSTREGLEEALCDALKSVVLGGIGSGVDPRVGFCNKFQREMEEHDRDFEEKYDEDLNATLIFVSA